MIRAGLMGAGVGLIYVMSLTLLHPLCTLCFTPLLGVGVGYGAGWLDKPLRAESSLRRGIIAGGLTGLGVVSGQMVAALVNGILVTNSKQLPQLLQEVGLPDLVITNSEEYWQITLIINSVCGMFNLALVIGLGALGSVIWFQRQNNSSLTVVSS